MTTSPGPRIALLGTLLLFACSSKTPATSDADADAGPTPCKISWSGSATGSTACSVSLAHGDHFSGEIPFVGLLLSSMGDATLLGFNQPKFEVGTYTLAELCSGVSAAQLPDVTLPTGNMMYDVSDGFVGQPLKGASATLTLTAATAAADSNGSGTAHGTLVLTGVEYNPNNCDNGTVEYNETCGVGKGVVEVRATF